MVAWNDAGYGLVIGAFVPVPLLQGDDITQKFPSGEEKELFHILNGGQCDMNRVEPAGDPFCNIAVGNHTSCDAVG